MEREKSSYRFFARFSYPPYILSRNGDQSTEVACLTHACDGRAAGQLFFCWLGEATALSQPAMYVRINMNDRLCGVGACAGSSGFCSPRLAREIVVHVLCVHTCTCTCMYVCTPPRLPAHSLFIHSPRGEEEESSRRFPSKKSKDSRFFLGLDAMLELDCTKMAAICCNEHAQYNNTTHQYFPFLLLLSY